MTRELLLDKLKVIQDKEEFCHVLQKLRTTNRRQCNGMPELWAYQNKNPNVEDNGGIGWGLLGCCIPVAGLVLFLVWKDTKPRTAKAAGIGALVSVILGILYYLLVFVGASPLAC